MTFHTDTIGPINKTSLLFSAPGNIYYSLIKICDGIILNKAESTSGTGVIRVLIYSKVDASISELVIMRGGINDYI